MTQHTRTRIKVCGLTRPDNAQAVEACGVDAIGLVFYPPSSRAVTPAQAREIGAALGPFTQRVALFVDPTEAQVEAVVATGQISCLQFHGNETDTFCSGFGMPYFKALRMHPELDCEREMAAFSNASGILLDAYQAGVPGGTGARFDWNRVPSRVAKPLILAGGLTPANVADAIAQTSVYGVDLSGGVESAPGIKDPALVAELVAAVNRADRAKQTTSLHR